MQDTTLSALEANGRMWVTMSQRDAMQDIDNRIKFGDESGWRGDRSMYLCFNQPTGEFEVWGADAVGKEYRVLTAEALDIRIVQRLNASDPRKHDVWQEVIDDNVKAEKARDDAEREVRMQAHDKLKFAVRQDFATHLGGKGGLIHIPTPSYKTSERLREVA